MNITTIPRAVLRTQYRLARFPLQLIEDRVVAKMGSEAPGRLFYERSVGQLDATVGRLLGDAELQERGVALAERSDALRRAARLDAAATAKESRADAALKAKRSEASDELEEARDAKAHGVQRARAEADRRKQAATEAARQRTAAAKKHADDSAARRRSAAQESERDAQARIQGAQKQAAATAKAKLDGARDQRNAAEGKRAKADRVEMLADAEKQKRQAARASKN